jgi:hypothetical protein
MKGSRISDNKKRRRGRPATGVGMLIGLRWHEPELKAIDEWRSKQADLPSRAEAIRRLVKEGLAGRSSEQQKKAGFRRLVEDTASSLRTLGQIQGPSERLQSEA